jgi:hypothetical protein
MNAMTNLSITPVEAKGDEMHPIFETN